VFQARFLVLIIHKGTVVVLRLDHNVLLGLLYSEIMFRLALAASPALLLGVVSQHSVEGFVIPSQNQMRASTRLFDVEEDPESLRTTASPLLGIDEDFIPFPSSDLEGPDIVNLCMNALLQNGVPYINAGLETCWNFSSDTCRASQGGSLEHFIQHASNPIFASLVNAESWSVSSTGPIIPGTPTRGAMQTVLTKVVSAGKEREFLWTLQRERRPPRQNCWLIRECLNKDQAYQNTL
jgi:hypothetical protein